MKKYIQNKILCQNIMDCIVNLKCLFHSLLNILHPKINKVYSVNLQYHLLLSIQGFWWPK